MKKSTEILSPTSCLSKARDDELIFVLLERDKTAAEVVRYWCTLRVKHKLNTWKDHKIREALAWAEAVSPGPISDDQFLSAGDAYDAVLLERKRQVEKWGGPLNDDALTILDWHELIADYNSWARRMATMGSYLKARQRYVQIAALAIAAVESLDRKIERDNRMKLPEKQ